MADPSAVDALNVATRNYIQSSAKLIDSVFQSDPLINFAKRREARSQALAAELSAATGASTADAELAVRVIEKMENSP